MPFEDIDILNGRQVEWELAHPIDYITIVYLVLLRKGSPVAIMLAVPRLPHFYIPTIVDVGN